MLAASSETDTAITEQPQESEVVSSEPVEQPAEPAPQTADTSQLYTVTRIYDGDTIDAFKDGNTIKVRLACIDAPEADQSPHGQASQQQLSSLVPGQVSLNIVDEDRYGRQVAEVYTPDGSLVNQQMVETGHAVVYTEYLSNCGSNADALLAAEQQAQSSRQGVWADAAFVMPWDYRQGGRTSVAEPEIVLEPEPQPEPTANLPACVNGDCNCSDFSSWAQAQDVLAAFPGDPHGLDRDNDGEACESLR